MRATARTDTRQPEYINCPVERQLIADQNDLFRRVWPLAPMLGRFKMASDIAARSGEFQLACLEAVRHYDNFTLDTDLQGTHRTGAFKVEGETVCFEISLLDETCKNRSAAPADLGKTRRVLTIYSPQDL
ncbi:DUF3768 domain-containing protein [uncultured Tateyamaria sp.]|uniref:DUF3768 domain-containing protein n=1 Tax=uncultured Tateyamaria sp. TaxID=455651 RepID=UPI002624066B|nr:DUF3768 domain-containing protein [uncultured Tateyamaria sp.]